MKQFNVPIIYRSPLISAIKKFRKQQDKMKKDFTPTFLDLGPLQIYLARHFGFCYGVENAIEIAFRTVEENPEKRIFLLSEMIHNPLFNHLPLDPTKGQILTVKSDEIPQEESINRKCFVLPTGDHQFRVGATYEWSDSSLNITDEAKELLENDLKNLITAKYEIADQQAGVRPTVKDRRPI
ncbi:MAG: FAD-dependent oxidoreductase, partial [Terrimonas sp.]|nr:FAD-dependent oxidoreductase [Terrimonas sp.]